METIEYRTMDKSKWNRGPWDSEPDKKQWQDEATGLPCLIVRNRMGALCGYVGVPESHPLFKVDDSTVTTVDPEAVLRAATEYRKGVIEDLYGDELAARSMSPSSIFDVHGGLTFAGLCHEGAEECQGICHKPSPGEPEHVWWFGFDCAHSGDEMPAHPREWSDGMYRDFDYVTENCQSLARQLAAFAAQPA